MSLATILGFLKAILPTKRIAAWILGVLAAVLALLMGVNSSDLKTQFCANAPVDLPKIEVKPAAAAPVVAPVPAPAVKK